MYDGKVIDFSFLTRETKQLLNPMVSIEKTTVPTLKALPPLVLLTRPMELLCCSVRCGSRSFLIFSYRNQWRVFKFFLSGPKNNFYVPSKAKGLFKPFTTSKSIFFNIFSI